MRRFLLLLGCVACTELASPDAPRHYTLSRMDIVLADSAYQLLPYDTTANALALDLAGPPTAGAARVEGQWWVGLWNVRPRFSYGAEPILYGPYTGTYGVFHDTLYLAVRSACCGDSWLNSASFLTQPDGTVVGSYVDSAVRVTLTFARGQ